MRYLIIQLLIGLLSFSAYCGVNTLKPPVVLSCLKQMLVKDQSPNIYSWSSKTLKAINEPKHLHLSADWDSSNYKAVLSPKITRFSERKLIIDDFDYSYMERNSITEKTSITPFGVAMLTSEETTKGIILGKKASINVISKSKESLTEILDYEQAFRQNLALFKHKHPEAIKTRFLDILKEKAERTARYLIDSGVTLKIEKTENEILIIKINPDKIGLVIGGGGKTIKEIKEKILKGGKGNYTDVVSTKLFAYAPYKDWRIISALEGKESIKDVNQIVVMSFSIAAVAFIFSFLLSLLLKIFWILF